MKPSSPAEASLRKMNSVIAGMTAGFLRACLLILFFLNAASAKAEDKRFSMDLRQMGSQVQVTIENQGRAASGTMALEILFDGKSLQRLEIGNLPSRQKRRFLLPVPEPQNPGTYPVVAFLSYLNDGKRLSFPKIGYFHHLRQNILEAPPSTGELSLRKYQNRTLTVDPNYEFQVITPREIPVKVDKNQHGNARMELKNERPSFSISTDLILVYRTPPEATLQGSGFRYVSLKTERFDEKTRWIPTYVYPLAVILSFVLWLFAYSGGVANRDEESVPYSTVILTRWLFSFFTVSLLYTVFHYLYLLSDWFFDHVNSGLLTGPLTGDHLWFALKTLFEP